MILNLNIDITEILKDIKRDYRLENNDVQYKDAIVSIKTLIPNILSLKILEKCIFDSYDHYKKNNSNGEDNIIKYDQYEYIVFKYGNEYLLIKIFKNFDGWIKIESVTKYRNIVKVMNKKISLQNVIKSLYNLFKNDVNSDFKKRLSNFLKIKEMSDICIITNISQV